MRKEGECLRLYRWMDWLFDPPPKDLRKRRDPAGVKLYYQAQEEGYKRYKHLCYRHLILKSLLAFSLGLVLSFLIQSF